MSNNNPWQKIKDSIEEAIRPIIKKGEAMTPADLESLTKAVCVLEKISRIEEGNYFDDYEHSESDGNSYRRGRSPITGRYVSRDAMPDYRDARYFGDGTFVSHNDTGNSNRYYDDGVSHRRYYDANNHNDYSGHSIHDRVIDQLERMMDKAQNDYERQEIRKFIKKARES